MIDVMVDLIPFHPHPMVCGGHAQTLVPLFECGRCAMGAIEHRITLADGDTVVLSENCPPDWRALDPIALMIHGLAGCSQSPYMVRIAQKLVGHGVRVFRMDLRACGAGRGLARLPYHAGRSADVATALSYLTNLFPHAPLSLVGFSLGGNIVLKLAGEYGAGPPARLQSVVAIGPPIDLSAAVAALRRGVARWYDRSFARMLYREMQALFALAPEAPRGNLKRMPIGIEEIDTHYTAPVWGFASAAAYYDDSSAKHLLDRIRVPTIILAAGDDPLVPAATIRTASASSTVRIVVTASGGHLGFVGRPGLDPDTRWMDWRVVEWVTKRPIHRPTVEANGIAEKRWWEFRPRWRPAGEPA